jgi:hypothetical protein
VWALGRGLACWYVGWGLGAVEAAVGLARGLVRPGVWLGVAGLCDVYSVHIGVSSLLDPIRHLGGVVSL